MSQSERAAITSQCKSMAGMLCMPRFVHCINIHFWNHDQFFNSTENQTLYQFTSYRKRRDLGASKCEHYEKSVQDLMATVAPMINPFVKTAKSKLFEILESEASNSAVDIRNRLNNALIVDAMAVLQTLKSNVYIVFQLEENSR